MKNSTEKTYCEACEDCGRKQGEKCLNYSDTDCGLWIINHPKDAPRASKHTPGPYVIVTGRGSIVGGTMGRTICLLQSMTPDKVLNREIQANWALLCAAPELLAALENAEASIELVRCLDAGQAIDTEADNMLDSLQNRIRAAIAKAKGE